MLYNIIVLLIGCGIMKERIIEALKSVHRALNYEELDSLLNNKTIEETKEMNEALEELQNEGEIYHSNKNKYMLFSDSNLRKGVLRVNKKGYGFGGAGGVGGVDCAGVSSFLVGSGLGLSFRRSLRALSTAEREEVPTS